MVNNLSHTPKHRVQQRPITVAAPDIFTLMGRPNLAHPELVEGHPIYAPGSLAKLEMSGSASRLHAEGFRLSPISHKITLCHTAPYRLQNRLMTYTPHFPLAPVPDRSFTPVPVKPRRDGWTPERQAGFIEALAACGCVTDAAARVGMASDGAYDLLLREGSAAFRGAWDAALDYAAERLSEAAFSRALRGVAVPYYDKGQRVGGRRVFNEGLTRFLLQRLDRRAYARQSGIAVSGRDEAKVFGVADAVREVLTDASDGESRPRPVPMTREAPQHWTQIIEPTARHAQPAQDADPLSAPDAETMVARDADLLSAPETGSAPVLQSADDESHRVWLQNCAGLARVRAMGDDVSPVSPVLDGREGNSRTPAAVVGMPPTPFPAAQHPPPR